MLLYRAFAYLSHKHKPFFPSVHSVLTDHLCKPTFVHMQKKQNKTQNNNNNKNILLIPKDLTYKLHIGMKYRTTPSVTIPSLGTGCVSQNW